MISRPRATYTEPMSLAPRMKRPIPSSIEAEQRVQTLTVVADLQAPKNLHQNYSNTSTSALKMGHPKRKLVFQPVIFRGYVSFREGNLHQNSGGCGLLKAMLM